jgi:hypothetical protein
MSKFEVVKQLLSLFGDFGDWEILEFFGNLLTFRRDKIFQHEDLRGKLLELYIQDILL